MSKATCPYCGKGTTILVPPFRRNHRPIPKFTRHDRPESEGGGRCEGSFTAVPRQEDP